MITLTNRQARQFTLRKQGLLGTYRFEGKQGALEYVRQAGCIQFDPVDVCGRNAELVLQSRVKGFTKGMLYALLYEDRSLVDYPDKNLSIWPVEDWPCFARYRRAAREGGRRFEGLDALEEQAVSWLREHGPASSDSLPIEGEVYWHSHIHWSGNWGGKSNAARAALEQLYSTGELIIHHKKGARKFYDLAEKYLPRTLLEAPDPFPDDAAHQRWRILRRIGAVGLMWNRPSDAWLNIPGLKAEQRKDAFAHLLEEEKLSEIRVEGMRDMLYCLTADQPLLEEVRSGQVPGGKRCELLAPLDCLLWDRRLTRELFGFDYTWEIYTPQPKRKYGFYVLPLLYGDGFAGRVEAVVKEEGALPGNGEGERLLLVKNVWLEDGVRRSKAFETALERCIRRFAAFNGCSRAEIPDGFMHRV